MDNRVFALFALLCLISFFKNITGEQINKLQVQTYVPCDQTNPVCNFNVVKGERLYRAHKKIISVNFKSNGE